MGTIVASSSQVSACSSRSFAKLSAVVGVHGAIILNIFSIPLPWPVSLLPRALCALLCIFCGWELDAISAWKHIKKFKWTEFSSADKVCLNPKP